MKRSFRRKVNRSNKDRLYTIFAFFIVAPIISVLLAFTIVQNFILPRLSEDQMTSSQILQTKDKEQNDINMNTDIELSDNTETEDLEQNEESNDTEKTSDESTIESTFFSIQLGNFSSLTNAKTFMNELAEKNINECYIIKVDEAYKVFSGQFDIKEEAYDYLEEIRLIYEDAFVNKVSNEDIIFSN